MMSLTRREYDAAQAALAEALRQTPPDRGGRDGSAAGARPVRTASRDD